MINFRVVTRSQRKREVEVVVNDKKQKNYYRKCKKNIPFTTQTFLQERNYF